MAGRIHRIDLGVNSYLVEVDDGYVLIDTSFPRKQAALDAQLVAAAAGRGTCGSSSQPTATSITWATAPTFAGPTVRRSRSTARMPRWRGPGTWAWDARTSRTPRLSSSGSWSESSGYFHKIRGPGAVYEPFEPDVLLEDGQDLSSYGLDARVVLLPGHSRGSIGILTGDGSLFCGEIAGGA